MTTIRDLLNAGCDVDDEIVVRKSSEHDTAYLTAWERRLTGALNPHPIIVLDADDAFVLIADESDDEDDDTANGHTCDCWWCGKRPEDWSDDVPPLLGDPNLPDRGMQ